MYEDNPMLRRIRKLEDENKLLKARLDILAPLPFPEVGALGWTTSKGDPIEILGFDELSHDAWVRFPNSERRDSTKTYKYPEYHWHKYWTYTPPTPTVQDLASHNWREYRTKAEQENYFSERYNPTQDYTLTPFGAEVQRTLGDLVDHAQSKFVHDTKQAEDFSSFRERVDIFMRMALIALDSIQMQLTGISTVKLTAFDPPLHHIPAEVQPRFVPPGHSYDFDEEYGDK